MLRGVGGGTESVDFCLELISMKHQECKEVWIPFVQKSSLFPFPVVAGPPAC